MRHLRLAAARIRNTTVRKWFQEESVGEIVKIKMYSGVTLQLLRVDYHRKPKLIMEGSPEGKKGRQRLKWKEYREKVDVRRLYHK